MNYIDRVKNREDVTIPRSEKPSTKIPKRSGERVEEPKRIESTTISMKFWIDLVSFWRDLSGGGEGEREMKASAAGRNERERWKVEVKGEKRGRRRLGRLPKTGSTGPETGSTGLEIGSTDFAAARTVNVQKKRFDCANY
jgi:hypothetical protein